MRNWSVTFKNFINELDWAWATMRGSVEPGTYQKSKSKAQNKRIDMPLRAQVNASLLSAIYDKEAEEDSAVTTGSGKNEEAGIEANAHLV